MGQHAISARVTNVFLSTGSLSNFLNNKSAQYSMASFTGTFVYNDLTSKLTNCSSCLSFVSFSESQIFFVEVLILHSGTYESHSAIFLPTVWYADPGMDKTGLIGVSSLCILASPYNLGACVPVG